MSHHGHEDMMQAWYAQNDRERLPIAEEKLTSAVKLIQSIANNLDLRINVTRAVCDKWLETNGYDCKAARKRQRDRRAAELDAELARLRAERAKL